MTSVNEVVGTIKGIDLRFLTHPDLFSPRSLDPGTLAMLSLTQFDPADKVLDLGCGYGVVGVLAAKLIGPERVVMLDSDPLAVEFARLNAERNGVAGVKVLGSNGFESLDETGFTLMLSNPPYHADFAVPKHFIEKGFNRLLIGGQLVMVVKRSKWYENKLRAIFGGVRVREVDGYWVLTSERRTDRWANRR